MKNAIRRIIIADDDPIPMSPFVRELELNGYRIEIVTSASKVKNLLVSSKESPAELFIIDVMQPPGKAYSKNHTENGMYTGLFLAQDVRAAYPSVPIIQG